ncbi:hypothetical protein MIR68_010064 [Amoeboaphelidium protococcarum]|nr:hypothetical protein MIR68_010064 [Amoeboaphelidium protococcarum]
MNSLLHLVFYFKVLFWSMVPVLCGVYLAWRFADAVIHNRQMQLGLFILLDFYVLCELLFYIYFVKTKKRLQNYVPPSLLGHRASDYDGHHRGQGRMKGIATKEERWNLFVKCMNTVHLEKYRHPAADLQSGNDVNFNAVYQYLAGWFYYVDPSLNKNADYSRRVLDPSEIYMDNVLEFIGWAFFMEDYHLLKKLASGDFNFDAEGEQQSMSNLGQTLKHLDSTDTQRKAQDLLDEMKEMLNYAAINYSSEPLYWQPGFNPNIKSIRLTLDEVQAIHKPLLYYSIIAVCHGLFAFVVTRFWGFTRGDATGVKTPYYYRPPLKEIAGGDKANTVSPLFIQHGIGAGVFGYAPMLWNLLKYCRDSVRDPDNAQYRHLENTPIFLLEINSVSSLFYPLYHDKIEDFVGVHEMADDVEKILFHHGYFTEVTPRDPSDKDQDLLSTPISEGGVRKRSSFIAKSKQLITRKFLGKSDIKASAVDQNATTIQQQPFTIKLPMSITYVGHSLGTTYLSALMQKTYQYKADGVNYHNLVKHGILVDPVCFLLHHSDVAYNFIHRLPMSFSQIVRQLLSFKGFQSGAIVTSKQQRYRANWKWVELLLYNFASKELYISWTLGRCFYWHQKVIFKEDIPRNVKVSVVLGEDDAIVNAELIRAYLHSDGDDDFDCNYNLVPSDALNQFKVLRNGADGYVGSNLSLYYYEGKNHAHFLFSPPMERQVLQVMLQGYEQVDDNIEVSSSSVVRSSADIINQAHVNSTDCNVGVQQKHLNAQQMQQTDYQQPPLSTKFNSYMVDIIPQFIWNPMLSVFNTAPPHPTLNFKSSQYPLSGGDAGPPSVSVRSASSASFLVDSSLPSLMSEDNQYQDI